MNVRGPRLRILRRLGVQLPGLTAKSPGRRTGLPGEHGRAPTRPSPYRVRLEEKQKLRANYGVGERQLQRYLRLARARGGHLGAGLLTLLERRLDNVVFRLGLAPTIPAARQLVVHGHVLVDGQRSTRPGRLVRPGNSIRLTARAASRPATADLAARGPVLRCPSHLARSTDGCGGSMLALPDRRAVPFPIDDALIVEYYAR